MKHLIFSFVFFSLAVLSVSANDVIVAPDAAVEKIADGFGFTEGPAVDSAGNLFFVDDPNSKIHKWSVDKKLSVFVEESEHANGMYFGKDDILYVCEGGTGCVVAYDKNAKRTVIASQYEGKRFNKPNDLWVDPKGGIYFTDPVYGKDFKVVQDGEHVYYISPDIKSVKQVTNDLLRPNGLVGTPDGKTLYITDEKGRKVWKYDIQPDASITNKTLFYENGIDGMTIDKNGNVYITVTEVIVLNPAGKEIARIKVPETPSNVCFGGKDKKTLYITARKSVYQVKTNIGGN
ncbi:MAG: SMP-30/gluconolactonase/LRE family protein [Planctomycetaceae bacterium]|nr:SMP-30/gluconolactonase/LRE family protein [Planctomycetaceae bacterium]